MKIDVQEVFGTRCIVSDDGQKLHDMVVKNLASSEDVFLNFKGVRQYASPFFNFSIGQLLNNVSIETVKKHLHLEDLSDTGRMVIERVIENASHYHGDADYRRIVDEILAQQSEGEQ